MRTPQTLIDYLRHGSEQHPERPALHGWREGHWITWSAADYWFDARDAARGLMALGLEPGDRVGIVGKNQPEWVVLQFGAQIARGVPAPIFDTATPEQTAFILRDAAAKMVFCEGASELEILLGLEERGEIEPLGQIITFHPVEGRDDPRVKSYAELLTFGRGQDPGLVEQRLRELDPSETCLLVYTSGTTGEPKGVEQSHRGLLAVGHGGYERFSDLVGEEHYRALSYLPLSHQAEQLFTVVFPAVFEGEVFFCPDLDSVRDCLLDVRPTVFLGVPKVWEGIERRISMEFESLSSARAAVVKWCRETELAAFYEQSERGLPDLYMPPTRRLARKLALDAIRRSLGLDQVRIAATGSAPISPRTQEMLASIGIVLIEGYGLTETSGLVTVTDHRRPRFGTVGKPLPGVELRLSRDGEIEVRGAQVTRGYFGRDAEREELFTPDGFLRTGDLGGFDDEGNLIITGRKKEIIITAGGRNVAPVPLENMLQGILGVQHAVVVGDRMPYLSALFTLDPAQLKSLTEALGLPPMPMHEVAKHPKLRDWLEQRIDRDYNRKVARHQMIKRFAILPRPFSIDRAELTASQKKRRGAIVSRYAETVASLYKLDQAPSARE
jgi:long-chain acyl-CoA synthetase